MDIKNEGTGYRVNGEPVPRNDQLGGVINCTHNPPTNSAQVELRYGTARAPLARVARDHVHPTMWRIVWPDGRQSDVTNLTRAKDAAMAISERGPPPRNRRRLHWTAKRSNSPSEARTARRSAGAH